MDEQSLEIEQSDQLVTRLAIPVWRHAVDVAQQLEALDDGEIPPQLRALAEHGADARDVRDALAPRHQAADLATPGRRLENAAQDLDGRRLPGTVQAR